jgi:hypothetical protein
VKRRGLATGLFVAAVLLIAAAALSPRAQASRAQREELLYYPSGRFLKEAALGYDQAAAAWTWLRTVQYYGAHRRGDRQFDMMYHLWTSSPTWTRRSRSRTCLARTCVQRWRSLKGERLLKKACRQPRSWEVAFENGFANYVFLGNHGEAARYFALAASLPDAPEYTSRFAAFAAQRAGDERMAVALWREVSQRSSNPWIREMAAGKADSLQALLEAAPDGRAQLRRSARSGSHPWSSPCSER